MAGVTVMPDIDARLDSGVLKVGDDWPGFFMRGDHAIPMSGVITRFLNGKAEEDSMLIYEHVRRLVDLAVDLASAHIDPAHAARLAQEARDAGSVFMRRMQAEGKL